jgi:hypothetical protein
MSGYFIFLLFMYHLFFPDMITHDHGDVKYVHYGLDFYLSDTNHTVSSFAKFLRNLEKPPVHSSCAFFDGCGMTPLYEAMLKGKDVCMSSLSDCLQLFTFNLIIVLKPTNVDTCFIFCHCLQRKESLKTCLYFS